MIKLTSNLVYYIYIGELFWIYINQYVIAMAQHEYN